MEWPIGLLGRRPRPASITDAMLASKFAKALGLRMSIPGEMKVGGDYYGGRIAGCDQVLNLSATALTATSCIAYDKTTDAYAPLALTNTTLGWTTNYMYVRASATAVNDDAVYFGGSVPFAELMLGLASPATFSGDAFAVEYWNGAEWTALAVRDMTDTTANNGKRPYQVTGKTISFVPPSDWAAVAVGGSTKYWIRYRLTDATKVTAAGEGAGYPFVVTPAPGYVAPLALTVDALTIRNANLDVHSDTDVVFHLWNVTTGAMTAALTFAKNQRSQRFTGLSLAASKGDKLWVFVVSPSTPNTNVLTNVAIDLEVTVA